MARATKKTRSGRSRSEPTGGSGKPTQAPDSAASPFAVLTMSPFAEKRQAPPKKDPKRPAPQAPLARRADRQPDEAEESELFLEAMLGTQPLSGKEKITAPAPSEAAGPLPPHQAKALSKAASRPVVHAASTSRRPGSFGPEGSGNGGSDSALFSEERFSAPAEKRPAALRKSTPDAVAPSAFAPDRTASSREKEPGGIRREAAIRLPGSGATGPDPGGTEGEALFRQAMADVSPVRSRGRDLSPPPESREKARALAVEHLDELLSGTLEFALEYSEEYIEGHVLGLDAFILGRLRAGQYSPEAHLDLHGLNIEQAFPALVQFIKAAYTGGKRHLVLITGRGRNSPGGTPVLRERVQVWLTREPLKRVVLAFCSAQRRDGGAGALYVLLRKRKKQGKIIWDRLPSGEELLL